MPDSLIFYTNPMSRGRIVRWMLEEVGASYETVTLDYAGNMKAAEYLTINPMGKVPSINHNGTVVTECAAICAYLADAFPDANLAPAIDQRGDYYRWLFYFAGPVESAVINRAMGFQVPPDKEITVGYGTYDAVLDTIEYAITRHPFITGETFTAADVYAGSHIGWGLQFGTLEKRPAFESYYNRLSSRDAFLRAQNLDNALASQE